MCLHLDRFWHVVLWTFFRAKTFRKMYNIKAAQTLEFLKSAADQMSARNVIRTPEWEDKRHP